MSECAFITHRCHDGQRKTEKLSQAGSHVELQGGTVGMLIHNADVCVKNGGEHKQKCGLIDLR